MGMQVGTNQGVRADINVTPLIDVVLVLLIIFMVITPMLTKGKPVPLPRGIDPAKKADDPNDLIFSITSDKLYFLSVPKEQGLDANAMTEEAVIGKLKELNESGVNYPLFIKASKSLEYGVVKKAMLMCEEAGFRSVTLVAEAPQ